MFPLTSVAVKVTVLGPTFEQLKLDGVTDNEARPHEALDPLLTCAAVIEAVPEAFR